MKPFASLGTETDLSANRFESAELVFVHDPDEVPADATPFDMRGGRALAPRWRLRFRDDDQPGRAGAQT